VSPPGFAPRSSQRAVTDPPWSDTDAADPHRGAAGTAHVLSWLQPVVQMLGLIHPRLRTAMLPHELLRSAPGIQVQIGAASYSDRSGLSMKAMPASISDSELIC
jgi:hypothetical protein